MLMIQTVPLAPALSSFVTEVFHDCCLFLHSPRDIGVETKAHYHLLKSYETAKVCLLVTVLHLILTVCGGEVNSTLRTILDI